MSKTLPLQRALAAVIMLTRDNIDYYEAVARRLEDNDAVEEVAALMAHAYSTACENERLAEAHDAIEPQLIRMLVVDIRAGYEPVDPKTLRAFEYVDAWQEATGDE